MRYYKYLLLSAMALAVCHGFATPASAQGEADAFWLHLPEYDMPDANSAAAQQTLEDFQKVFDREINALPSRFRQNTYAFQHDMTNSERDVYLNTQRATLTTKESGGSLSQADLQRQKWVALLTDWHGAPSEWQQATLLPPQETNVDPAAMAAERMLERLPQMQRMMEQQQKLMATQPGTSPAAAQNALELQRMQMQMATEAMGQAQRIQQQIQQRNQEMERMLREVEGGY